MGPPELVFLLRGETLGHDQLFKALLEKFFRDFLELFFPAVAERLDFGTLAFLDKGLFADLPHTLLDYAKRQRNGAIFKRLGFLTEQLALSNRGFPKESKWPPLTKGTARLDPALPAERLVTRWQLWIPKDW